MSLVLQFFLIIFLTTLNALFASSELSVLSVNKTKIALLADDGNKRAKMVQKLMLEETVFLSTIQVGITLAGFLSSATAAVGLSDDFGKILALTGMPVGLADSIALVVVTLILSYITLVFGELFPKRLARIYPEKIAMALAPFINILRIICIPFVKLLTLTSDLLAKIFHIKESKDDKISEEELISVIDDSVEDGTITATEQKMIEAVFQFNDIEAKNIMTPRKKVFMIDIQASSEENIDKLISQNYSRVVVYDGDKDNIIGVIYLKDLLKEARQLDFSKIDLKKLVKPPLLVRDRMLINKLFTVLQTNRTQLALLKDDYHNFVGLVTMEDLIEEIFGSIRDEYDEDEDEYVISPEENVFILDALTSINDINKLYGDEVELSDENYDSLLGYINYTLGFIPTKIEEVDFTRDNLNVKAISMKNNYIDRVRIEYLPPIIESETAEKLDKK